jgi:hypothetical protein
MRATTVEHVPRSPCLTDVEYGNGAAATAELSILQIAKVTRGV